MQDLTCEKTTTYFFRDAEKTQAIHVCVKAIANVMRPLEQIFGKSRKWYANKEELKYNNEVSEPNSRDVYGSSMNRMNFGSSLGQQDYDDEEYDSESGENSMIEGHYHCDGEHEEGEEEMSESDSSDSDSENDSSSDSNDDDDEDEYGSMAED